MAKLAKSHAIRRALRAELRAAGQRGHVVSNMKPDELRAACLALGLDVARIEADAIAANDLGVTATVEDPDTDAADAADALEEDTMTSEAPGEPDAITARVAAIREGIMRNGFAGLDDLLTDLVREAAKPPVEVVRVETVTVTVPSSDGSAPAPAPVPQASPTTVDKTWRDLFGVRGPLGSRSIRLWDGAHPDTPRSNARYVFPVSETLGALTELSHGANVYLYGPPGTGKTEWASEFAARTGRPFALISCDSATDGPTLVGMTVPQAGGGTVFQPGQLTRAIGTPGCVICLDEPSVARPGALFVLQNVLANRVLFIAETGARIPVAKGVVFIATDNTNGTGGGGRRGFTDTNQLNAAFLDRFGPRIDFSYLPPGQEAKVIVAYTGCTVELAELLVTAATTTRAASDAGTLTSGISLRRLFSWARLLTDGHDPETAFKWAVLNAAKDQDRETLRQQCLLAYDRTAVERALDPAAAAIADAAKAAAQEAANAAIVTPEGAAAAREFTPYDGAGFRRS